MVQHNKHERETTRGKKFKMALRQCLGIYYSSNIFLIVTDSIINITEHA